MENVQDSKNQVGKNSEVKNMESKGYMAKTGWEIFYDFLTEVFAILIPGAFFTSFLIFGLLICIGFRSGNATAGTPTITGGVTSIIGLLTAALTYCFGAFFHRREIKVVDEASARHIYKKSKHTSGHSFAFANAISESYVRRFAFILQYHLYLYEWDVKKPREVADQPDTDRKRNQGDALVRELNAEILEELKKTVELTGILGSEDPEVRELASRFMDPAEADTFQNGLVDIVRRKILAEKSKVRNIDRARSGEYKLFLAKLNEERHGTLKDRLEQKVWRKLSEYRPGQVPKKAGKEENIPGAEERRKRREEKFYRTLKKALENLCSTELVDDKFPEIVDRQGKVKVFLGAVKDVKVPLSEKNEAGIRENEQLEHAVRRIRKLIDDDLNSPVEWPYTRMYQYCFDRGLSFAELVNWGDGAAAEDDYVYVIDTLGLTTDATISDEYRRSKIRLNTDKVEIGLEAPALGRILEKNEAHIRFNNSMWYAADLMLKSLGPVAVIILAAFITGLHPGMLIPDGWFVLYFAENVRLWGYLLLLALLYLAGCLYIRSSVREIMHYQRVREVTLYLEAKQLIRTWRNQ